MNGSQVHSRGSRTIACRSYMLIIGTFLLGAGSPDRFAAGATLSQLFGGNVLNVGDSQFSDWELISSDSTAAATPDLSQIVVNPLADDLSNPGLQFVANNQISVTGVSSIDLTFKFRVHALVGGNTFTNGALEMSGIRFGGSGGLAFVTDEVISSSGDDLAQPLVIADHQSNFSQTLSTADFAPQSSVFVIANIFISGLSATDAIDLTVVHAKILSDRARDSTRRLQPGRCRRYRRLRRMARSSGSTGGLASQ